jgi:c-di-GMP-binding flagellar brake protein YcgR
VKWFGRRDHAVAPTAAPAPVLEGVEPGGWVRVEADSGSVEARVAVVDDAILLVDVPAAAAGDLRNNTSVEVTWPAAGALMAVRARLAQEHDNRWRIVVTDDVAAVQRRSFVRVPASLPVRIRTADGRAVRSETHDLSERGLRFTMQGERPPGLGEHVTVTLVLDETPLAMSATVTRTEPAAAAAYEVVVAFDDPYPADDLRRWVLAAQLELRARRHQSDG